MRRFYIDLLRCRCVRLNYDRRDDLAVDDAVADVRSRRHGRLTRGGAGPDADVLEGPEGGKRVWIAP